MSKLISFIHVSDEYREQFSSKDKNRPTFYWLTDRYFDHLAGGKKPPAWKYLYVFVKDPLVDRIEFRSRHEGGQFHALFKAFVKFQARMLAEEKNTKDKQIYNEPGIMCSFSKITPDLICKYNALEQKFEIIYPLAKVGIMLDLFHSNGLPKNFLETNIVKELQ